MFGTYSRNLDQNRWVKRNLISVRELDYWVTPMFRKLNPRNNVHKAGRARNTTIEPDPIVLKKSQSSSSTSSLTNPLTPSAGIRASMNQRAPCSPMTWTIASSTSVKVIRSVDS